MFTIWIQCHYNFTENFKLLLIGNVVNLIPWTSTLHTGTSCQEIFTIKKS